MKYKVGDKVKIKSLDWYHHNKDSFGSVTIADKKPKFTYAMSKYCGMVLTIDDHTEYDGEYYMIEDDGVYVWTDEMIEGLAEEEISQNAKLVSERFSEYVNPSEVKYAQDTITKMLLQGANIPNEYILKDENGNIINAKKIVLEKRSSKTDDIIKWLRECDMTKYIGVLYSGMCSITFDTEKLIKDITEMIGDE